MTIDANCARKLKPLDLTTMSAYSSGTRLKSEQTNHSKNSLDVLLHYSICSRVVKRSVWRRICAVCLAIDVGGSAAMLAAAWIENVAIEVPNRKPNELCNKQRLRKVETSSSQPSCACASHICRCWRQQCTSNHPRYVIACPGACTKSAEPLP